jgi:hypothetical protein
MEELDREIMKSIPKDAPRVEIGGVDLVYDPVDQVARMSDGAVFSFEKVPPPPPLTPTDVFQITAFADKYEEIIGLENSRKLMRFTDRCWSYQYDWESDPDAPSLKAERDRLRATFRARLNNTEATRLLRAQCRIMTCDYVK